MRLKSKMGAYRETEKGRCFVKIIQSNEIDASERCLLIRNVKDKEKGTAYEHNCFGVKNPKIIPANALAGPPVVSLRKESCEERSVIVI